MTGTLAGRNPVDELDAACDWLRLLDDLLERAGHPPCTGPVRADVATIAGWLRRHPRTAVDIALNMPTEPDQAGTR